MLKITVTSHDAKPLPQALAAEFGANGGTIGRAPGSTLLLPDPDRVISRTHAYVTYRDGAYLVRDHGTVVPVIINARTLGNGREGRIDAGDEIRIGKYVLRVDQAQASVAMPPGDTIRSDSPPSSVLDATMPPADTKEGTVLSWAGEGSARAGDDIRTVVIPSPAVSTDRSVVDDLAAATAPTAAPMPSPTIGRTAPQARVAGKDAVTEDALLRALLEGAQVPDLTLPGGLTPELMREIGRVLRETVRGVLDLLTARALAKREVRADATVIVAQDNNPLKFSPSATAAITHLVMPRGEGFMPPLRAVTDAYASLHSHQLGFVEGMRAALGAVLAKMDPHVLESKLTERSVADSLLPMNHRAKLWEAFAKLHGEVAREADGDFHAVFGREFLRAYQARVAGLRDSAGTVAEH